MTTTPRAADAPPLVSPDPLTPEERNRFAEVYAQILAERFGSRPASTLQRLEFTRDLQQSWRRGWTAVGKTYRQINLKTPRRVQPARLAGPAGPTRARAQMIPLAAIGVAALLFIWFVFLGGGRALSQARLPATPTPYPTGTPSTPPPTVPPPTVGVGGISIGAQTTPTTLTPMTLKLAGRSFVVSPTGLNHNKNWVVADDSLYASWLAGSLVNLTFFLALDTDPNAGGFVDRLHAGTRLPVQLTMSSDTGVITTRTFAIDSVRTVARTDTDVYNSTALGLTILVRYDTSDHRLYLHGHEILPSMATPTQEARPPTPPTRPAPTTVPPSVSASNNDE